MITEELEQAMMSVDGILDTKDRPFLRDMAAKVQEKFGNPTIVNIGVLKGASCYCLRVGAPKADIIGVDPLGWSIVEGTLEMKSILSMRFLEGRSIDVHTQFNEPIHMIFVDGGHSRKAVQHDILHWVLPYVVPGGYALFHDAAFADGEPFQHVGVRISLVIDETLGSDWEEQELMYQTRWFIRREM